MACLLHRRAAEPLLRPRALIASPKRLERTNAFAWLIAASRSQARLSETCSHCLHSIVLESGEAFCPQPSAREACLKPRICHRPTNFTEPRLLCSGTHSAVSSGLARGLEDVREISALLFQGAWCRRLSRQNAQRF